MNELRRNAVANIAGRVASGILWILVTPFVLSRLGPERFAIWSLLSAFSIYMMSLDLGSGSTVVRFIAAQRASSGRRVIQRTLVLGIAISVGLGALWAALIGLSRGWIVEVFHVPSGIMPEALDALLIFSLMVLLTFPTQTLLSSLQGFERLDLSNLCLILGISVQALALYAGLSAGGGLRWAAMAGVLGQVASAASSTLFLRGQLMRIAPDDRGRPPAWRDLLHFSAALQLIGLLLVLQFHSGRIIVGVLGNLRMVAEYELAARISYAVYGVPALLIGAVVPTASRMGVNGGWTAVTTLFASTSRWMHLLTVATLGSLWLLAQDLTSIWLGPGHEGVANLIRLWAIAYAIMLAYAPGIAIARGIGKPWFEVLSYCAAVATNIGLAIWCVPRIGNSGAVVSAAVSFVIGFVVFAVLFHSRSGIRFRPWLRHELAPRAMAGLLAVALGGLLVAGGPWTGSLPSPGWTRGAVTALFFAALLALFFLPLGDTQRLTRMMGQMRSAVFPRGPGIGAS